MNVRWISILVLAACKDERELGRRVDSYCDNLASETRAAAAEMKQIATHLDSLSVVERPEAEADITMHPSSADFTVRLARTHALLGRFNFCVAVRSADRATRQRLETRGAQAVTALRGHPLDGERPAYQIPLKALEDLAGAVDETNALPLVK